jgi:hypothetical protein
VIFSVCSVLSPKPQPRTNLPVTAWKVIPWGEKEKAGIKQKNVWQKNMGQSAWGLIFLSAFFDPGTLMSGHIYKTWFGSQAKLSQQKNGRQKNGD